MIRAAVREIDAVTAHEAALRAVGTCPNYVTPRGLEQLRTRLSQAQKRAASLGLTDLERGWIERELRWLHNRVASAIPVARTPRDDVGFGASVEVASEGETRTWRIVGDDEADVRRGLVSWTSPLARALLGARIGDTVRWDKPAGPVELVVLHIDYPA